MLIGMKGYTAERSERSEIGGKEASANPNREIGFGFVSCSCRACERAGEAKLRGRVGDVLLNAGGSNGKNSDSGVGCTLAFLGADIVGFKEKDLQKLRKAVGVLNILLYSLLFAWVFWNKFCRS